MNIILPADRLDHVVVGGRGNEGQHSLRCRLAFTDRIDQLSSCLATALGNGDVHIGVGQDDAEVFGGVGDQPVDNRLCCQISLDRREGAQRMSCQFTNSPFTETWKLPLVGLDSIDRLQQRGRRRPRMLPLPQRDVEAPILQVAQRVLLIIETEIRHQMPAPIAPAQRLGRRHAMHDLRDPALVHAVFSPGAWEVLDATNFDRRHATRHVPDAMSMGVSGRVGDDRGVVGDDFREAIRAIGIEPEISVVAGPGQPLLVMPHHDRPDDPRQPRGRRPTATAPG